MHQKISQQGMTLIEVLVALVVFGYAAITLVTASSANLSSQTRLRDKTLASWVAQNQLVEFLLTYQPDKTKKETIRGQEEMAGQTFYYQIKVTDSGWVTSDFVVVDVSSDEQMEYLISSVTSLVEKP